MKHCHPDQESALRTRNYFIACIIFFQLLLQHDTLRANVVSDSVEYYVNENKYLKGLAYAKKHSLQYLTQKKYFEFSKMTVRQAEIFLTLNDHRKALKILLEALRIVEKNKETAGEIVLMNKLGNIYVTLKQYNQAKKYYHTAIQKARKIKNDSLAGRLAQPLYRIHSLTGSDSTLFYLKKTLAYSKSVGTNDALSTTFNNYFAYYHSINDPVIAKIYLDSSLFYARKSLSKKRLSVALSNLVYHQMMVEEDYQKAKETYREIFALTPHDTISEDAADIYMNYSYLLEMLHDYKGATVYLSKTLDIMETTFDEQTTRAIRDLELRYQTDKIEAEYFEKQKLLEETESKNKKIFVVFVGLLILSLILFYFFHQNSRLKQKNRLKDIESRVQQNIINATIDGQENERKKIAAVLHDNISAMLSSAGLQLSAYVAGQSNPAEEITKTRKILKETHDKVRDLSHELVPVLLAKFGLLYAVADLCDKNSTATLKFACDSKISQKRRYNEDFEMKVFFIITELFNNVIKHSEATEANLLLSENDDRLTIVTTDNGKGFDSNNPHLNEGFGLTQIRARVLKLKGTFNITSRPNTGTTVHIKLPIEL